MPRWWNGRHRGLKILGSKGRAGSIPARGISSRKENRMKYKRLLYELPNFMGR